MRETRTDELIAGLNDAQRAAVLANDGPVLILAGAGSGKTRAITHKIAWLVAREGLAPWEILAVTFTNKAAREMRERCGQLLGPAAADLWLGTFHRIGVRLLRRHGELLGYDRSFVIYDASDQKAMLKRTMERLKISDKQLRVQRVQGWVNRAKLSLDGADEGSDLGGFVNPADRLCRQIYEEYVPAMRAANAVDFSDLIALPLRLMREFPIVASEYKQRWQYVLVDEFQDTDRVQYALLRAVLNDHHRICVVGDDDQSIYRWRGAEVGNILGFGSDYPEVTTVRLERNYRSTANILAAAGAVIANNSERHPKSLWTERDPGAPVRVHEAESERGEAEWVASQVAALRREHKLSEIAIFYRTNAQSRALEDAVRRANVPYRVYGGLRFYDRAEVKDVLAYLKFLANTDDVVSLERIINNPPRGIGKGTIAKLRTHARHKGCSLWQAARDLAEHGTKAVKKKLGAFVELIDGLREPIEHVSAFAIAQKVIEASGYLERLEEDGSVEAEARIDNVNELLSGIGDAADELGDASLGAFLDQVALVSDLDLSDAGSEALMMMTAHTAKGLEFDNVFVVGFEEGLMPHFNSMDSREDVEEERRLAYVAMTRARERLHLSYARSRRRFGGEPQACAPSRFLAELEQAADAEDEGTPELELSSAALRRSFGSRYGSSGFGGGRSRRPSRPAVRAAPSDDFYQEMPDYEDFGQEARSASAGADLTKGARVYHPQYGEGLVEGEGGKSGKEAVVKVRFADGSLRRIVSRFLTRL